MRHSVYCLATDLLDEGPEQVLANLHERGHVNGISVAAKYHSVRDVYPHNPRRRVATIAAGVYYQPDVERYRSSLLVPTVSPLTAGRDLLEEVAERAPAYGMDVAAWVVLLHADEVDASHPCVQVNCWGDGAAGALCPAHPDVREYACSLVAELSAYPVSTIRAEALHYQGLAHGHHHERSLERYGQVTSWLLGVCFCEHCLARAAEDGIDGDRARQRARTWVEESFARTRPEPELSLASLAEVAGEDLSGYARTRARTVASLVADASMVAGRKGARLVFIDETVATGAYDSGQAIGSLGVDGGWQTGVDAGMVAGTGATVEVTAYVADIGRFEQELDGYRQAVPGGAGLSVILRPGSPDSHGAEELADKMRVATAAGCSELNFYNYGLYRLEALDRIGRAIELSR